jgi:hypothetical protein
MMCASWRWISTGADKPVIAVSELSGDLISREIPQGGEINRARWLLGLESITIGAGAAGSGVLGVQVFVASQNTWSLRTRSFESRSTVRVH